jgi:hypothetical protein
MSNPTGSADLHFDDGLLLYRLQVEREFQNPTAREGFRTKDSVPTGLGAVTVPEDRHRVPVTPDHRAPVNRLDHLKQRKMAKDDCPDQGPIHGPSADARPPNWLWGNLHPRCIFDFRR